MTAVYDFILDPWSPGDTGYVSTEDGLYKSTNLDQVTPTWSLVLSPAQAESGTGRAAFASPYKVMGSINQYNYVVLFFIVATNELRCAYSEDGGSTWTFSTQIGDNLRNATAWLGAAEIVPHTIGNSLRLFAAAHYSGGNQRIYKSDNKGRTWSLWLGSPPLEDPDSNDTPGVSLSAPYDDNLAGNILYATFYRAAGGVGYGWFTTDGSTVTATTYGATLAKRTGLGTHTHNRQHVSHWTQGSALYVSQNGGVSWSQRAGSGITANVMSAGGFPYNDQQYYVLTTNGVFVSIDGGNTFTDKSGDWALGFSTSLGRGVVVPNWTE